MKTCPACAGAGELIEGSELLELREAAGYSQAAVAALVGVSAAHLSRLEHGHKPCSPRIRRAYEALAEDS